MKIIATSIVVLAAAASAGESNLRLGRNLQKGKKPPQGMAYGYRCCKDLAVADCDIDFEGSDGLFNTTARDNYIDDDNCDLANLKFSEDDFKAGFLGCEINLEGECDAIEEPDRRRELKKPNRAPNGGNTGNGKPIAYGARCCRDFDISQDCNAISTAENITMACDIEDDLGTTGPEFDKFVAGSNGCFWNETVVDGVVEGCEYADADE